MRLKQIKLAGFKSFVDPTSVPFPENLTAIVGPNGCGKSNLIDAVRWVMGESSAKHLRGDSMTDVIFNGSTTRKPVGQASIELVFDNSAGTLGGEYAKYAEISLRRTVNRESVANYYLNGTRCRRRDITDIFLGTGLGPRSYAIIEQGMISRLIESKPAELRIFLEEAAGISKYKERRRETENRIRHTRENMERLADIREELGKQIAHLQRQANAAAKYKDYKQQERQLKAELSAIKWKKYASQVENLNQEIGKQQVELESHIAEQRKADKEIEASRQQHVALTDAFNTAQGKYYQIGADIMRLEQNIAHKKERQSQLNEDLVQVSGSLSGMREQIAIDEQRVEELQTQLLEIEPEQEIKQAAFEEAENHRQKVEDAMQEWEEQWESYSQTSAQNTQKMEVERTRIQHFEKVIERLLVRVEQKQQELTAIEAEPIEESVIQASKNLTHAEQQTQALSETVESLLQSIATLRQKRNQQQQQIDECRSQLQKIQGKHISLSALQNAALGLEDEYIADWLEHKNINKNNVLAKKIKVDAGWESAVELVLGDYLQAVTVDSIDQLFAQLQTIQQGKLTLVNLSANSQSSDIKDNQQTNSLLSKVQGAASFAAILNQVKVADTLADALKIRQTLKDDQSVISKDGFWLARNWMRIAKQQTSDESLLQREAEIKTLSAELQTLQAKLQSLEDVAEKDKQKLREAETNWQEQQAQLSQANKKYSELRAQVGSHQAKLEQTLKRKEDLTKEVADLKQQLVTDEKLLAESRTVLEKLVNLIADDTQQKEQLSEDKQVKRRAVDEARAQVQNVKELAHQLELKSTNIRSEINSLKNASDRMQRQLTELQSRKITIEENLGQTDFSDEDFQAELEAELEKRLHAEKQLAEARDALEAVDQQIRKNEQQRNRAEEAAQVVRSHIEKLKMQWSESQTMQNNQAENLPEGEKTIQQILQTIDPQANQSEWQNNLEALAARIQRLGAINLAAIDEHQQQSERKVYLDSQYEDLEESLNTLEGAIRKIDKETRTRFKETFEKVNAGLKELFPKVFGGGHAYLELTGEDLLDTGVTVMARPPGKRNSTIHLLSGGEKALTALSLVFSIFRLNPAPFCMLDEVDAPLDDANVARFCKLVKEMSDTIQFIYITHNKVSMEMARSLAGVTMQEPGASRLVAVDVDEAAQLIAQ